MRPLRYRPPLVTYRVVKARKMTAMQAQYLARKSRRLGRGDSDPPDGGTFTEPIPWRAFRLLALAALAAGMLGVLAALALLTWVTVELIAAIF